MNSRQNSRIRTNLNLRSVNLPNYSADVVDFSLGGARVKLKGRPSENLLEDRIRFGVMLNGQMSTQFEGFARVVWIRETSNGAEAGLQWEKMTGSDWEKAENALALV